jgi:hypothetical protein
VDQTLGDTTRAGEETLCVSCSARTGVGGKGGRFRGGFSIP